MSSDRKQLVRLDFLWLLLGCGLLLFMGGKWNIPMAVWLGSIFFLKFFRSRSVPGGFLVSFPLILVSSYIFFIGLAEQVTPAFRVLITVSYALYVIVPCLLDRLLYRQAPNMALSTLVYPASLVLVQFLLSFVEPLGTTLSWTQFLFSMKPFIQLVSLTGVWGPTFLIGWLASVVNTLWEERFQLSKAGVPVALFCVVFAAVMLWGGIRMAFFGPGPRTVKAGSVVVGLQEDNIFWTYLDMPESQRIETEHQYRLFSREIQEELFAASERLVPAGIRLLSWASGNAVVFADEEEALIRRMQAFAREHGVYFFPCLLVIGEYTGPDRTKVLAIKPDGEIAYIHYKGRNPNAGFHRGQELEFVDTPYGRIASPICYEMEYHRYIGLAGKQGVDILIVPGDEPSRDNAVVHTEISMFRGIENGCSVLRTTLEGLTMGMDYQGRVLSRMNYYLTEDNRILLTELPSRGVYTLYSRLGDWFAYADILFLIYLVGTVFWSSQFTGWMIKALSGRIVLRPKSRGIT